MKPASHTTILIVDDSEVNIRILREFLVRADFEVLVARDGMQAITMTRTGSVDLILLDVMMPTLDGFEVCYQLKADDETQSIPIIFMTALDEVKSRVRGLTLGAVDYITIPFQREEVLARLNVHLRLHALTRELKAQNEQLRREVTVRAVIEEALWESSATLTNLLSNLPGIAYRCRPDTEWTMEFASIGCQDLSGYPPETFTVGGSRHFWQLIHEEDCAAVRAYKQQALAARSRFQTAYRIITAQGDQKWVWEQGQGIVDAATGGLRAIEGFIADITAQKQAEIARQRELERALLLKRITADIRSSLDTQQILQTAASALGQALQVNRCTLHTYDTLPQPRIPRVAEYYADIQHTLPEVAWAVEQPVVAAALASDRAVAIHTVPGDPRFATVAVPDSLQSLLFIRTSYQEQPNGAICLEQYDRPRQWQAAEIELLEAVAAQMGIAIAQAHYFEQAQRQRAELSAQNIALQETEAALVRANQNLHRLATLDGLTGVANRRQFNQRLRDEWQRLRREQKFLALVLCDVDYFKQYNDTYGHLAGDDSLRQIARALERLIQRPDDLVARYGGEEFAILLPNTTLTGAAHVAGRLTQAIAALELPHQTAPSGWVTISAGVAALVPLVDQPPELLIAEADR
ncbi:MAG: diguanylate cyclase, partial [Spirulinaceae cyanobacterium RM2_2_10]|nr:diguanylate cyclase [Spirulinaceae cyanobacterium RM2_2_10]